MDSYSNKASPWLRNAFVNLPQEVRNRIFYSRRVAVGCSSLRVEIDLYRAVGCSSLGIEIDFYGTPLWIKTLDFQVAVQVTEPDDRQKKSSRVKS